MTIQYSQKNMFHLIKHECLPNKNETIHFNYIN